MKNIVILLISTILLSCALIKTKPSKLILSDGYKSVDIAIPKGYCLYKEDDPIESDVISVLKEVNKITSSSIQFLMQECDEKKNFINSKNPLFRTTATIGIPAPFFIEIIKKRKMDYDIDKYLKFFEMPSKYYNLKTANEDFEKGLKRVKDKNAINFDIIDNSKNLSPQQKSELKLVHSELFGNNSHIYDIFKADTEKGLAQYTYRSFQVGQIKSKCVSANTLINHIPVELVLCSSSEFTDITEIKLQLKQWLSTTLTMNVDKQ